MGSLKDVIELDSLYANHFLTEVFKDLTTEFIERKSHDSSSLTNQRIVVTSCRATYSK